MTAPDLPAILAARERLIEAERAAYAPGAGLRHPSAIWELVEAERAAIDAVRGGPKAL